MPRRFPLVTLVILDGWGCAPPGPGNAVELADTPVFDRLWRDYPHTTLDASGEAAGLPPGQMGNSEVGHLTIGSGRRLYQDLMRVNQAIADGSLFENPVLRAAFERGRRVHLLGLVSQGGVHSHIDHLRALLELAPEKTWIHAFTDGRDVSPHAAIHDLATLPQDRIATVVGRYYAMDRDNRAERTLRAVEALTAGVGTHAENVLDAVQASYDAGVTDEFIEPIVIEGTPRIEPGDTAIFFNFRPDRGRQLSRALLDAGVDLTTMTRYSDEPRLPGRLRRADDRDSARRGARPRRHPPAPRRRDREVRPRDVLLQRRRRARVAGRDADPRAEPARRAELRPQAGDVGRAGRRALSATRSATGTASRSSTSRTRTWSGTRA